MIANAKPFDEEVEPTLLATVDTERLQEVFPGVIFQDMEKWSEPEPSLGAVITLSSGRPVGLVVGCRTGNLTVYAPHDARPADVLSDFCLDAPAAAATVRWTRPQQESQETMTRTADLSTRIKELLDQRIALEAKLQNEKGELPDATTRRYDNEYASLQRQLANLFREAGDDGQRITIMLEMMRILENRLVYLQNFIVEPSSDTRILAQLVTKFIDQITQQKSTVLTTLEATYYRAVAALYAGDVARARQGFADAAASEESDEANDIKYKSYVILGHLSHEEADYEKAKELHDQSLRYSQNNNVTAQALALKALNSYALQDYDGALALFEEALALFDSDQPFFNSYFFRNALLFCGAIYFDRKRYDEASKFYARVVESVEQNSYDYFDALSHLGRIHYTHGRFDEAVTAFEKAIQSQKFSENEYIIDTWFWIARTHLKRNDHARAKTYLQKVAGSDVRYDKKPQAMELLQRVG
jgi:tetratricopeptide (TPR) repeat protein